jgi:hypothetical protein
MAGYSMFIKRDWRPGCELSSLSYGFRERQRYTDSAIRQRQISPERQNECGGKMS